MHAFYKNEYEFHKQKGINGLGAVDMRQEISFNWNNIEQDYFKKISSWKGLPSKLIDKLILHKKIDFKSGLEIINVTINYNNGETNHFSPMDSSNQLSVAIDNELMGNEHDLPIHITIKNIFDDFSISYNIDNKEIGDSEIVRFYANNIFSELIKMESIYIGSSEYEKIYSNNPKESFGGINYLNIYDGSWHNFKNKYIDARFKVKPFKSPYTKIESYSENKSDSFKEKYRS